MTARLPPSLAARVSRMARWVLPIPVLMLPVYRTVVADLL
jgi:hypothetical protein